MRGKTEKIDAIIQKVLARKGITRNIRLNRIRVILDAFFTEKEAGHLKVGALKNDKLVIQVDSPSLLYEIRCFRKEQLLECLKQKGDPNIKDITLVLDK
jgi:hypothetical protein